VTPRWRCEFEVTGGLARECCGLRCKAHVHFPIDPEVAFDVRADRIASSAPAGVTEDAAVLNFDRGQRYTFNKSFEQYVSTRVGTGRINSGRATLARHAALLSSIAAR
jgi:membrane-bound lytic murein transglycosylase B